MTSLDLRTRIKHLLDTHRCDGCTDDPPDWTGHLADVLIRELGLIREYSIGDDEGGRVLWFDGEEPVAPREGEAVEVRYITEWTADG